MRSSSSSGTSHIENSAVSNERDSGESDGGETVGVPVIDGGGGGGSGTGVYGVARRARQDMGTARAGISGPATMPAVARDTTLPLPYSLGLAAVYILTSMLFFLSIRYSKAYYKYDSAFLVVAIELTKLCVSVGLKYREDGDFLPATVLCGRQRRAVWRSGLPYAIPSLLYAVYNNMTFLNLNMFDPGTYQVFMQTRILFTGILFTLFLRQALTCRKWIALVVLMTGCAIKYLSLATITLDGSIAYMLFQALLSSLAGVYNEYVFKKDPGLSIHQQNFFMYLYALVFNITIGLLVAPAFYLRMDTTSIAHPIFVPIIFFGAATGLSAALILKYINVMVKVFASAAEVLLTAVAAALLLGEALTMQDVGAALVVMVAVYVYYTRGVGDSRTISFGMQ